MSKEKPSHISQSAWEILGKKAWLGIPFTDRRATWWVTWVQQEPGTHAGALGSGSDQRAGYSKTWPPFGTFQPASGYLDSELLKQKGWGRAAGLAGDEVSGSVG